MRSLQAGWGEGYRLAYRGLASAVLGYTVQARNGEEEVVVVVVIKERSCYPGAGVQDDRPGAILGREVVVGILRSGRQSLTGGCERNVSESRKEWQLVARSTTKRERRRSHRGEVTMRNRAEEDRAGVNE